MNAVALLHIDAKVDAAELARAVVSAAVLGAERAGALRLRVGEQARWLGLRKVPGLFLEPGDVLPEALPDGTLERDVARFARASKTRRATAVLADTLREDASWPELLSLDLVKRGLAKRGHLGTETTKRLGVFKEQRYVMPDETRALVRRAGADDVRALFDEARTGRADAWALLQQAIDEAHKVRKESTSDGPD